MASTQAKASCCQTSDLTVSADVVEALRRRTPQTLHLAEHEEGSPTIELATVALTEERGLVRGAGGTPGLSRRHPLRIHHTMKDKEGLQMAQIEANAGDTLLEVPLIVEETGTFTANVVVDGREVPAKVGIGVKLSGTESR